MKTKLEWSKSYPIKPRDNIISHVHIKAPKFIPSYENDHCHIPMSWLLGMEYARIWWRECEAFINEREKKEKPKRIQNDYQTWLKKRAPKAKKIC